MRRTTVLFFALLLALATGVALIVAATTVRTTPVGLASIEVVDQSIETVVAVADDQNGDTASSQPLVRTTIDRLPGAPAVIEVNRVAVPPGARLPGLVGSGPEVLLLEAGRLTVQVSGPVRVVGPARSASAGDDVSLRPGEYLFVPTGAPFAIENSGQVTATILELALRSTTERSAESEGVNASALAAAALTPGVSVQRLADGLAASLTGGPATIVLARMTLAPGVEVGPSEVAEAELVAIESGTGDLTIASGEGQLRLATGPESLTAPAIGRSGGEFWGRTRVLTAGEGAFFPHGAAYGISNTGTGSLILLVVQIVPTGGDAG